MIECFGLLTPKLCAKGDQEKQWTEVFCQVFLKVLWSLLNECFHTLEALKGLVLDYVGILRLNVFWRSSIGKKGQNLVTFRIYSAESHFCIQMNYVKSDEQVGRAK